MGCVLQKGVELISDPPLQVHGIDTFRPHETAKPSGGVNLLHPSGVSRQPLHRTNIAWQNDGGGAHDASSDAGKHFSQRVFGIHMC